MKKSILFICAALAAFTLTAFAYINWNSTSVPEETTCIQACTPVNEIPSYMSLEPKPELLFKVGTRFINTVSMERLDAAKTIIDILPEKACDNLGSFENVRLTLLSDHSEIIEIGTNEKLTAAQKKLLQSADCTRNIRITSDCQTTNPACGKTASYDLVYYLSVVPEKVAQYEKGADALIDFLRENTKTETVITENDKLQPCQIKFNVTAEGAIENVRLDATSGYPSIDETLLDLMADLPGKWIPATNQKGEKINQELVFFFGKEGC